MKERGDIVGLLGIWLIVASLWRFAVPVEMWSNFITGVIVALLGFSLSREPAHRWVSGIAGLWLIVSTFIPGLHAGTPLLINNIIVGVVLIFAGFSVHTVRGEAESSTRRAA